MSVGRAPTRLITHGGHRARVAELLREALPAAAPESIERLADTAPVATVAPGELIFRQGETIPFTLVIQGHGAFRRTTVDGRELLVGIASPGWLVGQGGIAGRPASVDLVAITPTRTARWSGQDVRGLVFADAGLAVSMVDALSRYLGMTMARIEGFIHQQARLRVLRVLAENAELFFSDKPVLSRTLLPGLVGTSREMTGRVLRALEAEGVIARVGRSGLRLLDPAALPGPD